MAGGYRSDAPQGEDRWSSTNTTAGRHWAGEPAKDTGSRAGAPMENAEEMAHQGATRPGMAGQGNQPGTSQPGSAQSGMPNPGDDAAQHAAAGSAAGVAATNDAARQLTARTHSTAPAGHRCPQWCRLADRPSYCSPSPAGSADRFDGRSRLAAVSLVIIDQDRHGDQQGHRDAEHPGVVGQLVGHKRRVQREGQEADPGPPALGPTQQTFVVTMHPKSVRNRGSNSLIRSARIAGCCGHLTGFRMVRVTVARSARAFGAVVRPTRDRWHTTGHPYRAILVRP